MTTKTKETLYQVPAATITLNEKERYAGIVLNKDGLPSHHLILLPQKPKKELTWEKAKEWAASIVGELPSRQEQSLLFANLKDQFESDWYWSNEAYGASSAWIQDFDDGYQGYGSVDDYHRARAVRRLPI